ncbi:MAG: 50S ribosomal protein L1 [Thermoproteota archaeon]|uniref:50S ribosomal protein L1 n=1 Tax=marine metagenome TaxID=408172 RepID=A0A382FM68_9ZZZZ|nr:50S ribosomal protein L1 [Thermoproteota archaeon]|tara:strand:- start:657 stop:1319 length:663 start_codon:yes stop_codon:yes gene_type:complete
MVNEAQLVQIIKQAKESDKERKFNQTMEMIMVFKDVDVKKGFAINEIIQLPKKINRPASVCIMATGDMGIKAKKANADRVINEDELTKLGANKRESRKIINKYDFFLADTKLMPTVGKVLGQLLGPRGKMPTPVPFNAPIESFLERFRASIKVRVKGSLSMSCKIGEENMDDLDLAANANAVATTIEKKLPNGNKNIKKIMVKTTMGNIVKLEQVKEKNA